MRRKGSLQELINPGSEYGWSTFAFAGNDALEEGLKPGFFNQRAEILQDGDLILFGCSPARQRRGLPVGGPRVAIRRALLMVLHGGSRDVTVKLLQDWGGVDAA